MLTRYVICVLSVLWLQAFAAPAQDKVGGKMAATSGNDNSINKRSAGDYPVFGGGDFKERPMVDWNTIYNNKRNAIKRQYLGQPEGNFNGNPMGPSNMVDWEKVYSKRKWMNEDDGSFGSNSNPMYNYNMVNWDKLFSKRANEKRAFGTQDGGFGSAGSQKELQKWAAFGRHARSTNEQ